MATFSDRFSGINSAVALKAPVRVATTANITLSGFQTIDGIVLADGDANLRVLVKAQDDETENGLYDAKSGAWTRCVDFDGNTDFVQGTLFFVLSGTLGKGEYKVTTTDNPIVLGTSLITFAPTDAPGAIEFLIDGGGGVIAAGQKGFLNLPFNGEITSWAMFADRSGSIVIDVWKVPFASFPPSAGNSITGSATPALSSQQAAASSTLTGWTSDFNTGDVLAFNVVSATSVQRVTLSLFANRQ